MGYRSGKPKQIVEQASFEDYTQNSEGWETSWRAEWQDMPEYEQKDLAPYRMLYMFFKCEEDVRDFERKIGQKIIVVYFNWLSFLMTIILTSFL